MVTAQDKLDCAKRELRMRLHVYDRRVIELKMTRKQADREIAIMQAIVEDYEKEAAKERLI